MNLNTIPKVETVFPCSKTYTGVWLQCKCITNAIKIYLFFFTDTHCTICHMWSNFQYVYLPHIFFLFLILLFELNVHVQCMLTFIEDLKCYVDACTHPLLAPLLALLVYMGIGCLTSFHFYIFIINSTWTIQVQWVSSKLNPHIYPNACIYLPNILSSLFQVSSFQV